MNANRPPADAAAPGASDDRRNLSTWSQRSDWTDQPDNFSFAPELWSSIRSTFSGDNVVERSGSNSRVVSTPVQRGGSDNFGSQREIRDDEARFVYVGDPSRTNEPVRFASNGISTNKYTVLTFLPRNLFEQFHRVAYVYLLVLVALNQIPQLGVYNSIVSVVPLVFILGISAIKDGYEDWRRHCADSTENSRTVSVLMDGEFRHKLWKDVLVGDVIKMSTNETLPCDMVILSTSDPTGLAYVQTINLDGESKLKTRYAKQEILSARQEPSSFTGLLIRCEQPNRNIYGFLAKVDAGDGKMVSLGPSNVILRGCEVKNTDWVIGVAVYTGMETKVMLNSSGATSKRSRLEVRMNREVILLAIILFVLCSVLTVLAGAWLGNHRNKLNDLPYYRKEDYSKPNATRTYNYYGVGGETVFSFLKAVIQFQGIVPIGLYMSMELLRIGQVFFMIQDREMFDEVTNNRFQCRVLNINEDLGQIKYVLSDKTGTLTENKMEFRCASVYGVDYSDRYLDINGDHEGYTVAVDGKIWRPKTKVTTDPELMSTVRGGMGVEKAKRARDFFLALATCNTIVPIVSDAPEQPGVKLIDYQGESPDEQALVYAAAAYGFVLLERTSGHVTIDVLGDRQRFDVLGLHEFDSDRKRMSVVVGCPDKTVKLFVKGADSSMFGALAKTVDLDVIRATQTNLHSYSSLGLRTLVVGMRELSEADFEQWQSAYEQASTSLFGRGSKLRVIASNVESNLHILGASGIEDKLQEGVPEAIESLRRAGIKVWVLTGDKQETAISIGHSCKLLASEMTQIVINCNSKDSCKNSLEEAIATSSAQPAKVPLALIIDGTSLVYVLETELEEQLFKVATVCDVVLCCRAAPLQKAGIVALIKNRTDDMTLAIGDGANDVSMIQMADVGIGISGQEGRQAVMASDFAMGQFRFLVPLLLVHGHWNYHRMAYMILYNFYRNAMFVFVVFWYVLYTAFSLTTAISEWNSILYSVICTAIPTIIVGILDKDLSRRTILKYPQLYGSGQREERYNLKLFILTVTDCVWQSLAIFFIPYLAYRHSTIDGSSLGDLWTLAVVILVNLHLAMDVFRWNWITHLSIWGSTVATVICVIIVDCIPVLPGYLAIFHLMGTGNFWLCLLAVMVAGMVPRFAAKAFTEFFTPSDIQVAREAEKFGNLSQHATSEVPMSIFSQYPEGFTE